MLINNEILDKVFLYEWLDDHGFGWDDDEQFEILKVEAFGRTMYGIQSNMMDSVWHFAVGADGVGLGSSDEFTWYEKDEEWYGGDEVLQLCDDWKLQEGEKYSELCCEPKLERHELTLDENKYLVERFNKLFPDISDD